MFTSSCSFCSECCKADVNKALKGNGDAQDHLCLTPPLAWSQSGWASGQAGWCPDLVLKRQELRCYILLENALEQGEQRGK